jgi:hypothetical protein
VGRNHSNGPPERGRRVWVKVLHGKIAERGEDCERASGGVHPGVVQGRHQDY